MSDIILETRDLKKHFNIKGGRVVKAVYGVSIQVERGKTLGLVGESGCGKSTLGRTIIRIYDPTEGKVILNGKDVSGKSSKHFRQELARSMQMIFQDPYACLNPRMTVSQLIAEGWDLNKSIHLSAAERKSICWRSSASTRSTPTVSPTSSPAASASASASPAPSPWTRSSSSVTSPSPPWTCPSRPR